MKNHFVLLLILVIIYFQATSQSYRTVPLDFKHITLEDGLPISQINTICEDGDGFIWFGTADGLCRYDGYSLKVYRQIFGDKLLNESNIPSLFLDSKKRLWMGLEGLNLYQRDNGDFIRIESPDTLVFGDVYAIDETKDGKLALGLNKKGVIFFDPETNHFTKLKLPDKKLNKKISSLTVSRLKIDSNGLIWMGALGAGLIVFDPAKNIIVNNTIDLGFLSLNNSVEIWEIYEDKSGNFWIGTKNNGLFIYDPVRKKVTKKEIHPINIDTQRIRKLLEDSYGNLWIGTWAGLYLYDKETDDFINYAHSSHESSVLTQNSVYSIYESSGGILWIGTYDGGVNYADLHQKPFKTFNFKAKDFNPNIFENINCFAEDSKGGLWVGSNTCLSYIELYDPYKTTAEANIIRGNVKTVLTDTEDNVWVGTYGRGLFYYDVNTRKTTNITDENKIYCLLSDYKQDLWVGTSNGLFMVPKGGKELNQVYSSNQSRSDRISALYEDNEGNIWFADKGDIHCRQNSNGEIVNIEQVSGLSNRFYVIYKDTQGNFWFGGDKALLYFNQEADTVINLYPQLKYYVRFINGILEDDNYNLWISTNNGLFKFENVIWDISGFQVKKYGKNEKVLQSFNSNAYFKNRRGEMFFGGEYAFNYFNPNEIQDNTYKPVVILSELKIFNKSVSVGEEVEGKIILKKLINKTDTISLTNKHKSFTLEFVGLNYADPESNKYKYRMLGFDDDWNFVDASRRYATYTGLTEGDYEFEVFASNNDNVWSEKPASLHIIVTPPFWKRGWFRSLLIFLLVICGIALYFVRVQSIRRENIHLEKVVKQRTLEIQDKNSRLEKQAQEVLHINEILNQRQEEIKNANEELRQINATKDRVFSIIAHDLINPISALSGLTQVLLSQIDEIDKTKQKEYISYLNRSANTIYSLLDNLLNWSRTQINKIKFTPEKISANELFEQIISLLQATADTKNIDLQMNLDQSYNITADANILSSILRNLVGNAIKFTPNFGTVRLNGKKKNNQFIISVEDTGVGMNKNEVERLFKIEELYSNPGTDGEKGTGLGLIICQDFIKMHGGEIWVESRKGFGTTFFVSIPINQSEGV